MNNSWINLHALWQIVVLSLVIGAGGPALFAVGLRALGLPGGRSQHASAQHASAESDRVIGGSTVGIALAAVCFAAILTVIGWGIYFIVQSG